MVRVDAVHETEFFAERLPERGAVAVADDDCEQVEQRRVGVSHGHARPGEGDAALLDLGSIATQARGELDGLGGLINRREAATGHGAEVFLN